MLECPIYIWEEVEADRGRVAETPHPITASTPAFCGGRRRFNNAHGLAATSVGFPFEVNPIRHFTATTVHTIMPEWWGRGLLSVGSKTRFPRASPKKPPWFHHNQDLAQRSLKWCSGDLSSGALPSSGARTACHVQSSPRTKEGHD